MPDAVSNTNTNSEKLLTLLFGPDLNKSSDCGNRHLLPQPDHCGKECTMKIGHSGWCGHPITPRVYAQGWHRWNPAEEPIQVGPLR